VVKYVSAKSGPKNSVIYKDSDGKQWKFSGGSQAWVSKVQGISLATEVKADIHYSTTFDR